ncbi:hypothetical protein [Mesorhizobium sp.]|uniref:hypothetical protein n=1 Tax=Mesorhizobium sp. TaxID=1871066 RepID=UPI000FE8FD57|nr:hypothetical protein [Mesorhizobium sp.]RWM61559.1 MAG: hypothetical protein EOR79_04210 [Mesorhizobium sp.]
MQIGEHRACPVEIEPSGWSKSHFWRRALQRANESPWANRTPVQSAGQGLPANADSTVEEPTCAAYRTGTFSLSLLRLIRAI